MEMEGACVLWNNRLLVPMKYKCQRGFSAESGYLGCGRGEYVGLLLSLSVGWK